MKEKKDIIKKKEEKQKVISTKGIMLFIFGLVPSILILIIFLIINYIAYINGNAFSLESNTKIACNLAETDIVATAVTIWVGLNIYNLITKEDLKNAIRRELKNSEEKVKRRNNKILQNQLVKEVFLERLEKTRYMYAISDFLVRHVNELKGIKYEEAAEVERYLSLCIQNYETNRWNDATNYSKKLLNYIKKKGLIKKAEEKITGVGLIYLYDRMGDAYFYMNANRGRGSKKTKTSQLHKAIKKYKKELKYLKQNYGAQGEDVVEAGMKAYVLNAIGYTFRLWVNEIDYTNSEKDLKKWYKKNSESIKYGQRSLYISQNKGRYIRNAGIGYEALYVNFEYISGVIQGFKFIFKDLRRSCYLEQIDLDGINARKYVEDKLKDSNGLLYINDEEKEMIKKLLIKLTLLYYNKAVELDKSDYKGYNNIGEFYLRILDEKYGVKTNRVQPINVLLQNPIDKNDMLEIVLEAERKLLLAREISPTFEDCRFNYAKAKMYEYFLHDQRDESIKREAIEEAKRVLIMNANHSGARCVLRNCYEAFGDIEKAIEENEKLENRKDAKKIKKLYNSLKE